MPNTVSRKAKLVLFLGKPMREAKAGQSEEDYMIYASYRTHVGSFFGTLKVVRQTDGRLLYPFDGSNDIGPFPSRDAAKAAAVQLGCEIVEADLQNPEL